ncbi:MAG TPA: hypothetical protein VFU15_13775, partial [Bacteroidia bacterium]|nr:hypothetical protein [Bacteroidia bacterium]
MAAALLTGPAVFAQVAAPGWVNAIGTGGGFYENGGGIRAGSNGKIYLGYRYAGSINLNGASPSAAGGGTACGSAQLTQNLSGTGQWATRLQSSGGYDYVFGYNIDVNNNTYTVGTVNSGGALYVAKTTSTGTFINSWNFSTAYGVGANGVCADAAGNMYIAASISSNQTFGTFPLTYQGGGDDMVLMKLNSAGTVQWAIDYGGTGDDECRAIEMDMNGNLWVEGGYTGTPTFGTFTAPAAGSYSNLFVAEFNPNTGACMNLFTAVNAGIGAGAWYEESDLRIDSCNNIYVAGHFKNTATWGTFSATSVGAEDFYVTKISPTGTFEWVRTGGSAGTDEATGIALDKNWDVLVGGYFSGTMTLGSTSVTATGNNDAFVAKYASGNGALMFVQKGGGVGYEDDYGGLTADDNRQVYLTGGFSDNNVAANTTQFGATNLGNGYYGDIYVAKLDSTPNLRIYPQPQSSYCSGGCYTMPFTTVGTFNGGNIFTAELSDANGSFASGTTTLGTVTASGPGTISVCIPPSVAAGSNYKIRITSSSPAYSSVVRCGTVTINGPPSITVSPNASICSGGNTTLTSSGASTYSWTPSSTLSSGTGSSVTATPTATTTYSVIGTDANGCTDTAMTTVTISNSLVVTVSGNTTICSGNSTTLTASGGGNYAWSSGGTSASETVSPASNTTYTVTVTDPVSGCSDTAQVSVLVNATPVAAVSGNNTICAGASTTLTASGGATYAWSTGGTNAAETVTPA